MKFAPYIVTICAVAGLATPAANAQSLRLVAEGHEVGEPLEVHVGDTISLQIIADFERLSTAGLAAYVTVPDGIFAVQDLGLPGQVGTQPFRTGPLFSGSVVATNVLLTEGGGTAAAVPGQQLDLAALFGLGSRGKATGVGVVATFEMLAVQPAQEAVIRIDDNPVRETRMVLADGRTERRFNTTSDLIISVSNPLVSHVADEAWGRIKQVSTGAVRGELY
jgi:hypothetical protein